MRDLLKLFAIFSILLLVIPSAALFKPMMQQQSREMEDISPVHADEMVMDADVTVHAEIPEHTGAERDADILKVLDFTSGQVLDVPMRDYVIGAVMAEMPAAYHKEALKAQAVAARTYAVRQREKQKISADELLMGADISNDSTRFQAYFTPQQAKAFYGDSYDTYYNIVSEAVDETGEQVLIYGGEPIVAAFHSTSGGRTESAEIIWGSEVEYLVPVDSSEDESSPAYYDEKVFTEDELRMRIEDAYPDADFSMPAEKWIAIGERSESGTVVEMSLCGEILSGTDFRALFGLRSANFETDFSDGSFVITTKGNGHGVGMSQYGANAMANGGADYEEILLHYYTGAELASLE